MTSTTYPSRLLNFIDVPEVKNVKGEFLYNFFEKSERAAKDDITDVAASRKEIDKISAIPRANIVSWTPITIQDCSPTTDSRASRFVIDDPKNLLTPSNAEIIQSEASFSNYRYVSIAFQDTGIDGRLFNLVSGAIANRGAAFANLSEAGKALNDVTSNRVSENFLSDAINSISSCGADIIDSELTSVKKRSIYDQLRSVITHTQVSNNVVLDIVNSSVYDRLNIYADEMASIKPNAKSIQNESRRSSGESYISSIDYDSGFVPLYTTPVSEAAYGHESRLVQVVGYIVEKSRVSGNSEEKIATLLSVGESKSSVVDTNVAYGEIYSYEVRSVIAIRIPVTSDTGEQVLATGLVSSKASPKTIIECTENVPPPAPADFKPAWNYRDNNLILYWSFPVNTQRDIKYFQVFKRKTTQDAFRLVREFNFDDSEIKTPRAENVPGFLTDMMIDNPRTHFVDESFEKESEWIYAICSVDAHGLSSGYSTQFRVKFNVFSNQVEVKSISRSGAPKSLPNLYLNEEVFVDTIKTSGLERMNVYFDPEYLSVVDKNGENLSISPTNESTAGLKIHTINTDLQKSKTITIKVKDLRT